LDPSDFGKRFDPGHPAADATGYVQTPNVNPLIESMDMREAQRSYEANLNVIGAARRMLSRTLEILRA
jgi:flagellar basal-body rod protein FlgC